MKQTNILKIENAVKSFVSNNSLSKPFYSMSSISPLKIIGISNALPSLNLSKEEIVMVLDLKTNNVFTGFVLTDKFLHSPNIDNKLLSIEKAVKVSQTDWEKILSNDFAHLTEPIKELIQNICEIKKSTDKKELEKDKKTEGENVEIIVTKEALTMLKGYAHDLVELIDEIRNDKQLYNIIQSSLSIDDKLKDEFEIKHIILQDLIRIYNALVKEKINPQLNTQFCLAYVFERMQGNDMAEQLSIERLNKLVSNPKFVEGVEKIKNANFLNTNSQYEDEFVLSSILFRMEHKLFEKIAKCYLDYATIVANSDKEVCEADKITLENLQQKIFHPKIILQGTEHISLPPDDTLEKVLEELNELVGLKNIKNDINDLINFLKIQKKREEEGLKLVERMLHNVFMGPPGTGKTTVARLIGRIYRHLGYLKSGHLVETDRAGMVAGFVGQTAIKVDEIVKSALNGVLFIDEAYALAKDDMGRDFGHEAIETLLKRMEDHRDNLSVIVAGYSEKMKDFIQSNPGLQSRFNRYFNFEHYTGEELLLIFKSLCKKFDFNITPDAEEKLNFIFDKLYEKRNETFGNARVVRNIFEICITNQANRLIKTEEITKELLQAIEEEDVPESKSIIEKVFIFNENNQQQK